MTDAELREQIEALPKLDIGGLNERDEWESHIVVDLDAVLALLPPERAEPTLQDGVRDTEPGWWERAQARQSRTVAEAVPEAGGEPPRADLLMVVRHNDGDECTGPTCGNPEHGWTQYADGVDAYERGYSDATDRSLRAPAAAPVGLDVERLYHELLEENVSAGYGHGFPSLTVLQRAIARLSEVKEPS